MGFKGTALVIGVLFGAVAYGPQAEAARPDRHQTPQSSAAQGKAGRTAPSAAATRTATAKPGKAQLRVSTLSSARASSANAPSMGRLRATRINYAGISCVPYARQATGMAISGNGWQWWGNAAGSYARGHHPEAGSVLAFRATGGMRHGHVAVVSQIVAPRHLLIDHANWGGPGIRRGSVMQDVHVIDVSDNNDWTDVRVQVGRDASSYGRAYPTYGFIYNRPDNGRWLADAQPRQTTFEEVAEAPETPGIRAGQRSSNRRTRR